MKKNIVYLLGAGASYNSIPIISTQIKSKVSPMSFRMTQFIDRLKETNDSKINEFTFYEKLIEEIDFYGTPDTLAKSYELGNKLHELWKLKDFLTSYLIFEQLEKSLATKWGEKLNTENKDQTEDQDISDSYSDVLDKRYLSFLATICNKDKKGALTFPEHLSIVSWNYDMQLERAYQEFTNCELLNAQNDLKVYPILEGDDKDNEIFKKGFSVLKLNGTAGFYEGNELKKLFDPKHHNTNRDTMNIFKDILLSNRSRYSNLLHFAWESSEVRVASARNIAKDRIKEAKVVVIIGYSFPDFNRIIDKDIFSEENLDKIYLQDPNAIDIIQKLEGVKDELSKKAIAITETSNFRIPYEFWE